MAFLDDDFLLTNEPAKQLFHQYAADLPIIDFHCHLNPQEIYENRNFKNITRIWLNEGTYGDHYKWRLNGLMVSLKNSSLAMATTTRSLSPGAKPWKMLGATLCLNGPTSNCAVSSAVIWY